MSTESPTAIQQSAAILHRMKKAIVKALEVFEEMPSMVLDNLGRRVSMIISARSSK